MGRGSWSSGCWFWFVQPRALPQFMWRTTHRKVHSGSSLVLGFGGSSQKTLPWTVIKTMIRWGISCLMPKLGKFYLSPKSLPTAHEVVHSPWNDFWSTNFGVWTMGRSMKRGSFHGSWALSWSTIFLCFFMQLLSLIFEVFKFKYIIFDLVKYIYC